MLRRIEGTRERLACWSWTSRRESLQGKPLRGVVGRGQVVPESSSCDPAVRSAMPCDPFSEDEDELDEARILSPQESPASSGELLEAELGATVLRTSDVFCCFMGDNTLSRPNKPFKTGVDKSEFPASGEDSRSGSKTGSSNEWQPCVLIITAQMMCLARKSPSEASTVTSVKAGIEQCLCTVSLARVVDVASSVCIFGCRLDQEERSRRIPSPALSTPLTGIIEDHATCLGAVGLLDDRLVAPLAERQHRLRKTASQFHKILRRVPQSDLHSMLVKVGPYDFKEKSPREASAGNNGNRGRFSHCPICESVVIAGGLGGYCERCSQERTSHEVVSDLGECCTALGQDCADDALWEGAENCLEHLRNGVAVGTFELPPIPFARLPETASGLPAKREAAKEPRQMNKSNKPRHFHSTHGGRPLCDYDESNCQPHMSLDAAIPPMPPSACRLPASTYHDFQTQAERKNITPAVESSGSPYPNIIIVWTTSSASLAKCSGYTRRLQQGTPILLSFGREEDAKAAYDTLLKYRAQQLEKFSEPSSSALDGPVTTGTPAKCLLPQFGAVAQSPTTGVRTGSKK